VALDYSAAERIRIPPLRASRQVAKRFGDGRQSFSEELGAAA
jgi:hypothetical protein